MHHGHATPQVQPPPATLLLLLAFLAVFLLQEHPSQSPQKQKQHQQPEEAELPQQYKLRQRIRWKWWQSNQLWNEKFAVYQRTEPFTVELSQMVRGHAQERAAELSRYAAQPFLLPPLKAQRRRENDDNSSAAT